MKRAIAIISLALPLAASAQAIRFGGGSSGGASLPSGTSGQVLQNNGSSWTAATPTWPSIQNNGPGAPQTGNVAMGGQGAFDTLSIANNAIFGGNAQARQFDTHNVVMDDYWISNGLDGTGAAYGYHQLGGQFRLAAIATPAAPALQWVGRHGAAVSGQSITFSNTGTITRTSGDFTADNYVVGSAVTVSGSASNNSSTFRITAATALTLTVTPAPVNETTSSATLTGIAGVTPYTAYVVCRDYWGNPTLPSPAGTANGNFVLDTTNYIDISVMPPEGAYSCDFLWGDTAHLLKTVISSGNGTYIGTWFQGTGNTPTSAYTAPTANTTADMTVDGTLHPNGGSIATFSNGTTNTVTIHSATNNPATVGGVVTNSADTQLTTTWSAFEFQLNGTETGSALVNIKKDVGVTNSSTIEAHLYTNNSGVPGTEISSTQVPETPTGQPTIVYGEDVGTSYGLVEFRLPYQGLSNGGLYWVVFKQTASGGSFYFGSATSAANNFATAADSGGAPGAWTGALKTVSGVVYGNAGRSFYGFSDNHYAFFARSNVGFPFRGIGVSGPGAKFDSTDNYGVGGTSVHGPGVRGSSNENIAVAGDSLGSAGGQFQCSVGSTSGCVGAQLVSQDGPAAQLVPTTGLAIQSLDGNNGNAQVLAVTHDGNITAGGGTNPVPVVHSTQTTSPVAIEFGTKALTAGSGSATFATAFSTAPVCNCSDNTSAAACKWSATTTTLTLTGTSTDTVGWFCIGAK